MIEGMIVMVITMFILIWILGLGIVSPMLHRVEICRNLIKQQTNNALDVLDDPAFLKYKNYFD